MDKICQEFITKFNVSINNKLNINWLLLGKTPNKASPREPSANTRVSVSNGHSVDVNCSMQSNLLTRIGMCYFTPDDNTSNINAIITNEQLFNESCALCTPTSDEPHCKFSFSNKQNWTVTTKIERDQNNCSDIHIINVHIPQYQHNDSELRFQCLYQVNDPTDRKPFKYWIGFDERPSPPSMKSNPKWYLWLTILTVVLPLIIMVPVVIYCTRKRRRRLHKSSKIIQEEYSSSSGNDSNNIFIIILYFQTTRLTPFINMHLVFMVNINNNNNK